MKMRTMKPLVFATLAVLLAAYREGGAEAVSDATPKGAKAPSATEQDRIDDAAMAQWKRRGEGPDWMAEELAKHKVVTPAPNDSLIGKGQGATSGSITREDVKVWQQETYKEAVEGSRIFHSGGSAEEHYRRLLRHVPSGWVEYPSRDLPEISGTS